LNLFVFVRLFRKWIANRNKVPILSVNTDTKIDSIKEIFTPTLSYLNPIEIESQIEPQLDNRDSKLVEISNHTGITSNYTEQVNEIQSENEENEEKKKKILDLC